MALCMRNIQWFQLSFSSTFLVSVFCKTNISPYTQCCGSGMFIPDPGSWFLPIPDPGSRISDPGSKNSNKRERWKKISCHTFLCSHKFHKIVNYFSFEVLKRKNLGQFSKNYRTFYQKNCQKALKNMVLGSGIRDPRSGIRDPEKTYSGSRIPDPGVKKHPIPDPGSRIRIRNTAYTIPVLRLKFLNIFFTFFTFGPDIRDL